MTDLSIAVFASGGGTNLQALIDGQTRATFDGKVEVVISNNSKSYALARASEQGIATYHISAKVYPEQSQYVAKMLDVLVSHNVNLIVLAGYMKLLPVEIIRRYRDRVINIHPALLPEFGGQGMYGMNVHKAVLKAGKKTSGATVHFVDEIYDHGPILVQRTVPVLPDDTPESLAARVLEIEHRILPAAVSLFV